MVCRLLGDLQLSAVSHVLRDSGGSKAVARDLCPDACIVGAPANHPVYVLLGHGKV